MKYIYIILSWIYSVVMPKVNVAYFCSFYGQYNDNPKYISNALSKINHIKQVWCKSNKSRNCFPRGINVVQYNSFLHYFYIYNAKVVVDNYFGLRSFTSHPHTPFNILSVILSRKSKNQLNIGTWHGTPLKKIGFDSIDFDKSLVLHSCLDYSISGCELTKKYLFNAFRGNFCVLRTGTPRNDCLLNYNFGGEQYDIRNRLSLPSNRKIVLFAPTFRNSIHLSGLKQIEELDVYDLVSLIKRKFGGEWAFVCRFHSEVLNKIPTDFYDNRVIFDGNIGDDMAEYLQISDILITDYSSCFFDYALLRRPCFLYVPDLENYITNERGTYLSFDELPFPYSKSPNGLKTLINQFDSSNYIQGVDLFLNKIGNFEDGNASNTIATRIDKFLTENVK